MPLLLLAVPAFATGAGDAVSAAPPRLRVLAYNIRHGEGLDGRLDLERTAAVIRSAAPDVVALQEVDRATARSGGVDQAAELGRLTGLRPVYGASMDFQGGAYGNAVLTSLEVVESTVVPLPGEPRSALCVTLRVPVGGDILFVSTHLDTAPEPRRRSVPLLEQALAALPPRPALLAGDLNATPAGPTLAALAETWQVAAPRPGDFTFPADAPARTIDYVLCRPGARWNCLEARVLTEPAASDHRPLLAVLELVPVPEDGE